MKQLRIETFPDGSYRVYDYPSAECVLAVEVKNIDGVSFAALRDVFVRILAQHKRDLGKEVAEFVVAGKEIILTIDHYEDGFYYGRDACGASHKLSSNDLLCFVESE